MRPVRPSPFATAFAALALAALALLGAARADAPLAALEPGLTGWSLTAGPDGIERFPVEILGLQYDPAGGFPLVLVRAGGPFIEAAGGVAAGMSGSPVYIELDGRPELVGAIGYVFPEADHSLALVTPIAPMRSLLRGLPGTATGAAPTPPAAPAPFGPPLAAFGPARPVATPVLMTGLSPRAAALLEPLFESSEVLPLPSQGGAAGAAPESEAGYRLEPGAAVSVQLARGDVTVAAIGTLTLLENGEVLAFGHPLLGLGPVGYALAPAFVNALVPADTVPFKLANSGAAALGAIRQDRRAALAGTVGDGAGGEAPEGAGEADPDLLPLLITLRGPSGRAELTVEVARHERLAPALAAASVLQALDTARGATRGGSAELAWEIELAGGERLNLLERSASRDDLASAVARLATEPLAILAGNRFRDPEVRRVALAIDWRDEFEGAEIVDLELATREIERGGTAELFVRLQPFRDEAIVETLEVPLPPSLEAGEVRLLVRGGNSARPEVQGGRPEDPPILSFTELLEALRLDPRGSELIVEVVVDDEWRRLERLELPAPVLGFEEITLTITDEDEESEANEGGGSGGGGDGDSEDDR